MGEVSVTIHGRDYHIGCQDGQEEHLIKLASFLDEKVKELVETVGNIGDMPLLAMAGILVADELADSRSGTESQGSSSTETDGIIAAAEGQLVEERKATVDLLDAMALRIDSIAASLEPA